MAQYIHRFAGWHRRWQIAGVLFLALAVAIGVASFARRHENTSSDQASFGPFRVEPQSLDFGIVWAQRDYKLSIPITNVTDSAVEVVDVIPSCGCTTIDRRAFSVAPSQTTEIHLSVDLLSKRDAPVNREGRHFPVGVMILLKSGDPSQIRLTATGVVKDWLSVKPPSVYLSSELMNSAELPATRLLAIPRVGLTSLLATSDSDHLHVQVGDRGSKGNVDTGNDEQSFPIEVALKNQLPCGEHSLSFTLVGTKDDGQTLPNLSVPVKVTVLGDVFMSPAFTHLGSIPCGVEKRASFQLISRRKHPFRITRITAPESGDFVITNPDESPQSSVRLNIAFRTNELGERSVPVTIDWERVGVAGEGITEADSSGSIQTRFTYIGLP